MGVKYGREFSRNYSLFQVIAYTEFSLKYQVNTGHPLFIYKGEGLSEIFYQEGGVNSIYKEFGKIASQPDYFDIAADNFLRVAEEIKPYFLGESLVKDVEGLKRLYDLYLDYVYGESVVWVAPLVESLSSETKARGLAIREQTQDLTSLRDEMFDRNLKVLFPELGELVHFLLPKSVFGHKTVSELSEEAFGFSKGFIYFEGNIYIGSQNEILKNLNIELKEIDSKEKIDSIHGQSASNGVAKGHVKIILTSKDLGKVTEGDILVSPMTRPDFLPAMKIASAFVTDEGGITCHAAIVSREMNKPCVIGTKIATKVLHDGDEVEVDATSGVVNILKRVS
ncbi:MAG: PEP-utilizing enzyme [Patescibacteria group bacterium]|jgi:phosphohistidine swiveling domain-containing protein